ncbi:hypothetical protein HY994_04935 [Candidatus Micrarchaeota archaeon]|nr:hypothetical protein [Candidatus Micrarchaeota archaeon]
MARIMILSVSVFAVLMVVLAVSGFASAYTDRAYWLDVQLKPNGGAHVVEKTLLNLDTQSEIDAFEFVVREGDTNLGGWQKFSRNIRYHVSGSVFNVSLVGTREFGTSFSSSSVTIEYDVDNLTTFKPVSSRTTAYRVETSKLQLGNTPGEFRLGKNTIFSLRLPQDAVRISVVPDSGTSRDGKIIRWVGPTVGTWQVGFDREISMADEVNAFFVQSYTTLASSAVLWLLLAFALAVVGYKIFLSRR